MFKGTVKFHARIKGNGLTFPLLEFNPNKPSVDKVAIEGPNGNEILSTVHLASVASSADGIAVATKVHRATMDRISFCHNIAIENGQMTDSDFSPVNPPPGFHMAANPGYFSLTGHEARFVVGLSAAHLKTELEQVSPGEHNFSLFRSALQSTSPVEEFMHLYNILLMLLGDDQAKVDKFVLDEDPSVPLTPDPRPNHQWKMETVYTRLRNELGHNRPGVNLDVTKAEMAKHLGGLIALTKRAIELHS
jgi:hypothetical protein